MDAREDLHEAITDAADHVDDAKAALNRTRGHRLPLEQREHLNAAGRELDSAEHHLFEARDPADRQLSIGGDV
jgi:cell division protein ZapA (FtsZ GTPase activity inhibitor)